MWIKCQDGSLVNLDNIVHVEKQYRYGSKEGQNYRVVAIGSRTEDDFYVLAQSLSESQGDVILSLIGNLLANDDRWSVLPTFKSDLFLEEEI